MEYTGERLVPGKRGLELLELEHRGRYDLAGSICAGENVLDVGCGTGYGTALLAQYARSVVGIDAAPDAIEFARENFLRDNLRFEVLDITSSEAENRLHEISRHKFDVVVCFELIEHLSSPVSLLDLVKTVLRPGGRFIVSTPNSARPHRFTERENPYHVVEYEREGLRGLLGGRFKHVHVLSQTVHLATRIQAGNYRERMDSWPRDQLPTAKYFVAICSDKRLDSDSKRGLLLLASDQHVTLLQSLLADLRKAQANKAEAIERLQALLDQATEDARSRQSRIENLTQEIEQRATAEQELRSLIEQQERTIHELNQEIDRLDVNTREVKRGVETDRSQSSRAKQDLERQIELQEDQVQQLTRQLEERAATIEELNDLLENDRLKSLRKKEDLERQIQLEEDQVQRLTRQLEERASAEKELQRQIERHQDRIRELNQEIEQRETEAQELKRSIKNERLQASQAKQDLERRINLQDNQIKDLTGQVADHSAAVAELENLLYTHELESSDKTKQLRDQISLQSERLEHLARQIDERSAAGTELDRLLEVERASVAGQRAEIDRLKKSLDAANEKLGRFSGLSATTVAEESGYLESFGRLTADLDRVIGFLEAENSFLEEQLRRGNSQISGVLLNRGLQLPTAATVSHAASSSEAARKDRLAEALGRELYHILTSRRWRLATALVQIKNFFTRQTEGSPLGAHLYTHFRRASVPVPPELRRSKGARPEQAYRDLVLQPPIEGVELIPLKDEERMTWRKRLEKRTVSTLVTVVMPTWNRAHLLPEAVASVIRQSYPNWELVIVDDGSDDNTKEVVDRLIEEDSRIRLFRIGHQGVAAARDFGLSKARGQIITYLDSDNTWDPDYLLFTVHAIRDSRLNCSYGILKIIDEDRGNSISHRKTAFDFHTLLKNNYIDINVFAHRVELVRDLGGFDHQLQRWVDWDLILRYTRHHQPAQIPIALCDYRRGHKLKQITSEEPEVFKFKVLNKHLIDWRRQERTLHRRRKGHVSVVLLNYRRANLTEKCVTSLFETDGGRSFDVVVVDNSATWSEHKALRELALRYPGIRIIESYENYGFALGNNVGAAAAAGEYVVWLNNDTEVEPQWLEPLIAPLESEPGVGVAGPKLLYPDGTIQHAGLLFSDRSKIPYHRHKGAPSKAPYVNQLRRFQALTGACLAIRAADFIALRGFDPLYLNGCEDLDLCFRMRSELHKEVLYVPKSTVIHHEGKSPNRGRHIAANRRRFVEQWGDKVVPDDREVLAEDGFKIIDYAKPGKEADGPSALYMPVLKPVRKRRKAESESHPSPSHRLKATRRPLTNVGVLSMWYERGVSYVAKQLAEGLEHTGRFRTYVLARWESERFQNRGSIYHPRVVNGGDDPSPKKTVAWAKQNGLDAVIFVEVHPKDWKRVDALQREGVTVIGYEHLDVLRLGEFDRYERLDGLLSSTFYGWREFKARFPDKPCLIVPWGIQPKLARQHLAPFQMAPTSGNGFVRFVHVAGWGGIGNRKNTDLVLRAFHETELQHARLRLYSQAPIEQYGDECVKIVRRDQRIELHQGTVDNIFRAYAHADVLLSPSKREGLGLPILEALACGIPTVISNGFTMAEWPIAGKHAVMCKAVPSQEQEKVPRYLPLLEVDESDLAAALRGIGGSPHRLWEMKRDVARDRHFWLWTWQPRSLALQLQKLLEAGGGSIGDERGFLPAHIIDFEQRRAASRRPGNGEPSDQQSGGEDGSESRVAPIVSLRETPEGGSVRHLFITGCQRSGTTALLHLLNEDSRIVLGRERYKYCRTEITPEHFTEKRFFSPRESETNYLVEEYYDRLHDRWKQGNVQYIGDKVPFYYRDLFYLGEKFPDCKVLFLVRDLTRVAASYNARASNPEDRVWRENMDYRQAVVDWNESLQKLIDFAEAGNSNQVFVVPYEDFFSGREEQLKAIYDFLGFKVSDGVVSSFRQMTSDWQERIARPTNLTAKMVNYLEKRRDREMENRVVSLNPLTDSDSAERTG